MRFREIDVNKRKRILARNVICSQGVRKLSLVDLLSDKLRVTPFDMETASTSFVDGVVVCLLKERVSDVLLAQCASELIALNTEKLYKWLLQKNALGSVSDLSADISLYQIS